MILREAKRKAQPAGGAIGQNAGQTAGAPAQPLGMLQAKLLSKMRLVIVIRPPTLEGDEHVVYKKTGKIDWLSTKSW